MNSARTRRRGWPTPRRTGRRGRGRHGGPRRRDAATRGDGAGPAHRSDGPAAAPARDGARPAPGRRPDAVGVRVAPAARGAFALRVARARRPRRRGLLSLTCPMGVWGRPACLGTASRVHLVVAGSVVPAAPGVWSVVLGAAAPSCVPFRRPPGRPCGGLGGRRLRDHGKALALGGLLRHADDLAVREAQERRRWARGPCPSPRPAWPGAAATPARTAAGSARPGCRPARRRWPAGRAGRRTPRLIEMLISSRLIRPAASSTMQATAKAALPEPGRRRACPARPAGRGRAPGRRPVVLGIRDGAVIWLMACCPFVALVRSATREPGRRCAGVGVLLGGAGLLGPAREQPQVRRVLGQLDRQARRGGAAGTRGEQLLGQPVLQRVVAEDRDPAADGERVDRGGQGALPAPPARR